MFFKKMLLFSISFLALEVLLFGGEVSGRTSVEKVLLSPDKNISLIFCLKNGVPEYSLIYKGNILVEPSGLGVLLSKDVNLSSGFELKHSSQGEFDKSWVPVWGFSKSIQNKYNELTIGLKKTSKPETLLNIKFRAYDDGVAFRYIFPEQPCLGQFSIVDEVTQFKLPEDSTAWWTQADFDSYEHLYKEGILSELQDANTPITIKTKNNQYASIHEANLTDYAGMSLLRNKNGILEANLAPWPDGKTKVKASTPFVTPWRTIQVADKPGDLVVSHLIQNLNDPCKLTNTSWIEPMKYVGIWWGMHIGRYTWSKTRRHGSTTENAKMYIDFASKHGIRGFLAEGWNKGWGTWGKTNEFSFTEPYSDYNLKEVVKYAKEKNVSVIAHNETASNIESYERQMEDAFKLYQKLGIHAIKTGYVGKIMTDGHSHHGQWMVNHYRKVVETAAKYQIMVDAHEPIKPTGISRTYPNMMSREGVRGNEYNAWSKGSPPSHTCTLPFTRGLAGPIDYTPGIFNTVIKKPKNKNRSESIHRRVNATVANQLALYVVIYSPLQMVADLPENYEGKPAFKFIEEVPVNWDETKVINAEIGKYVTIARKNGNSWYIGAITDKGSRELNVPLSFLDKEQSYQAEIYIDGKNADYIKNPYSVDIYKKTVNRKSSLDLKLARGGGAAIIIKPASN